MIEKYTVFVIDDDESMRHSLQWLIESIGVQVNAYASANEFLDAHGCGQGCYCDCRGCLVLDVQLPGINGLQLQKMLTECQCKLPIIFITGHGDSAMAQQVLDAGAIGFFMKPFDDQALLSKIQSALAMQD